jgi:hypothetical protein
MMGGGGRGDRLVEQPAPVGLAARDRRGAAAVGDALFGRPGPKLAAAIEAAADPVSGSWPAGLVPAGGSTDPWAQVIHAVVASRRLSGWVLWAQLSMLARWLVAWRAAPPVSNTGTAEDRCEPTDPALVERLNREIGRVQRQLGGQLAPLWQGHAADIADDLVAAELGLATGLTRLVSEQHVYVADALFVQDRQPRLRRLLRGGWVEWAKVEVFVRETADLDLVVAHAVERIILGEENADDPDDGDELSGALDMLGDPTQPGLGVPAIVRMTIPELRAAIAAAVAAIDAEAAARRAKAARAGRRVRCQTDRDGTATLTAELTVEAAAAVWNALTAAAKAARAAGDPRSLDQLRADTLVAGTTGRRLPPPIPGDTPDIADPEECGAAANLGDIHTSGDPEDLGRYHRVPEAEADAEPGTRPEPGTDYERDPDVRAADAASVRRAGQAVTVNLTMTLATYLGLANDPVRLDGFGPVAAGVARQIIRDQVRGGQHQGGLAGITWRCVVTDDRHGTVLGVGSPIHVPKHDPPPRLADLIRTGEPTCCFPGCRIRARDCDLDHRRPYDSADPRGDRNGGATCSCNLQPLCRTHHRLKTAGVIHIRAANSEEPGVAPGTLEFTSSTGLRYLRNPTRATPPVADLDDPSLRPRSHTPTSGEPNGQWTRRVGISSTPPTRRGPSNATAP